MSKIIVWDKSHAQTVIGTAGGGVRLCNLWKPLTCTSRFRFYTKQNWQNFMCFPEAILPHTCAWSLLELGGSFDTVVYPQYQSVQKNKYFRISSKKRRKAEKSFTCDFLPKLLMLWQRQFGWQYDNYRSNEEPCVRDSLCWTKILMYVHSMLGEIPTVFYVTGNFLTIFLVIIKIAKKSWNWKG